MTQLATRDAAKPTQRRPVTTMLNQASSDKNQPLTIDTTDILKMIGATTTGMLKSLTSRKVTTESRRTSTINRGREDKLLRLRVLAQAPYF